MNKTTLCCVMLLSAGFLSAAHAVDTRIITFNDALRIALEQNSVLRQARNAAELSNVTVNEARNQFIPDLRLNTNGAQNYGRNFSETEGAIINQKTESLNLGVSSGVTLFDGFRNVANLRSARFGSEASHLDLDRARETVVFDVASDFLLLIQQREQLRVQRDRLSFEMTQEQQISTFVQAGSRTIADLYTQQSVVANARLAVVQAERDAQLAEDGLIQTLQLDPRGIYEFQPPTPESIPGVATNNASAASSIVTEHLNLDVLLDRAYEQRSDLNAEKARVAAAEQDVRSARGGRWPSVSLSAGYNSGYTSASAQSFSDQLDLRRGGAVGVNVSIPIFDRDNALNATRRAELQAENARIGLENAKQDVALQVRRAVLDHRAAREQFIAAEAQMRSAEQALKATQDRYQAGAATLVELSQARTQYVQAASDIVTTRYNVLIQRVLVDYYVGDLDPLKLTADDAN